MPAGMCGWQVCLTAGGEDRRALLGVLYNELAQERWESRSISTAFNLEAEATKLDEVVLRSV